MARFEATHLITVPDEGPRAYSPGVIDVVDGRVAWAGARSDAPEVSETTTVTKIEGILMPGLVNTHAHSPMVLLRGTGEGYPTDQWLQEVMWPREGHVVPDDVRVGMTLGAAELLLNGITTSVEMYLYGDQVAEAAAEVGLRCLVAAPIVEDPQLSRFGSAESQLEAAIAAKQRWAESDLIEIGLGPHAPYSVSDESLREVARTATEHDLLVHTHLAEGAWEDEAIRGRTGMSAPEYLDSIGLLNERLLAAHAVWLSDSDIELLASRNVAVAHCPCSNMRHASGVARVEDMRSAGIRVGLGTDGPASHARLDMFEEARTAMRLARLHGSDARHLPAREAFRMVTIDAADAIGRSDLGRLTPGSWADMVAMSESAPAFHPILDAENDPVSRALWAGSPGAITHVWVGGKRLVENGNVAGLNLNAAVSEVAERADGLREKAVGKGTQDD